VSENIIFFLGFMLIQTHEILTIVSFMILYTTKLWDAQQNGRIYQSLFPSIVYLQKFKPPKVMQGHMRS